MSIKSASVVGIASGDGECFCIAISEQDHREFVGEEEHKRELEYRAEHQHYHHIDNGVFTVHPTTLLYKILGDAPLPHDSKCKIKMTIEVIEVIEDNGDSSHEDSIS